MSTFANVDLSDIIVSLAQAVSDANALLNADPNSSVAITQFEVDTTLTGTISIPATVSPTYRLQPETPEIYRISEYKPRLVKGVQLHQVLQPNIMAAMLSGSQTQSARIEIRAVIQAMPAVTAT